MKKKALSIILVVVLLVLGSVIFAKKYETMLNDGKTRNEEIGKAIEPADETNLQFKGPNYDRMRMYGGYDLESHDYAVTMGLGCIAWDVGYEPGLDSGTAGERLRGYLEGLGLQNQIDEYSGIYGSSIWNIEFSPLTDVAQARCTHNKGFTVCHIQAAGTGESTITYDIQ